MKSQSRFTALALTVAVGALASAEAQAADGANITGGSVPASLAAGATAGVSVTVTNTGTTTWGAQGLIRLAVLPTNGVELVGFSCGGYMSSVTDARVYTCSNVAPGATTTYSFTIRMPAGASGSRQLAVQMVHDGVAFFGNTRSWTISIPAGGSNGANITGGNVPGSLAAGATAAVSVTVTNTGTTTWGAQSAYRLAAASTNGVQFVGFQCGGYMSSVTDARVYTCSNVAPGATYTYSFTIKMPAGATGSRVLAVRMVQDGVAFFGNIRSWTISIPSSGLPDVVVDSVTVTPASPAAGQAVTFSARVRNAGTASTPSGVPIGVGYRVNGAQVTWGSVSGPLAPGAIVTVGTNGGAWTAVQGTHSVTAMADDINRFAESNESNNVSAPVSLTVGPGGGGNKNVFGINIDPANPAGNPSAAQLKAAGVRWVRVEWHHYSGGFGFYDPVIANYRAAGLKVLLIVDYTSVNAVKPSSTAGDAEWNAFRPVFDGALANIASHYGDGVDAWQIWNEPDLSFPGTGYDPGVPALQYGQMLATSWNTVRARSTRPVVTGGLASGNTTYLSTVRNGAGGTLPVDYVAVHPYGQRAPDNWPSSSWGFGNMSALLNNYLAFGKPLWISEIGDNSGNQTFTSDYLANVYNLITSQYSSSVPEVFWFCWSDGMVANFGIVDAAGNPKQQYYRYQSLAGAW